MKKLYENLRGTHTQFGDGCAWLQHGLFTWGWRTISKQQTLPQ